MSERHKRAWGVHLGRVVLIGLIGIVALGLVGIAFAAWQGGRTPKGRPEYVALGSSFAAGAGLGRLEPHPRDRHDLPPIDRRGPTHPERRDSHADRLPPSRLPPMNGRRSEGPPDRPAASKPGSHRAKSPPKVKIEEMAPKRGGSQRHTTEPALERRRSEVKPGAKPKPEPVKGAVQRSDKAARPPGIQQLRIRSKFVNQILAGQEQHGDQSRCLKHAVSAECAKESVLARRVTRMLQTRQLLT